MPGFSKVLLRLGVGGLGEPVPFTLAPPVPPFARLALGELEALRSDHVEVDLAHHVSRRGRRGLQALPEPSVTFAVGQGVQPVVEETVLPADTRYHVRTLVMFTTARVQGFVIAQVVTVLRYVPITTPLGAGKYKPSGQ